MSGAERVNKPFAWAPIVDEWRDGWPGHAEAPEPLDSHWACMTCSAGTNQPVTNRQAEIASANHASQGGHPTVYARSAK